MRVVIAGGGSVGRFIAEQLHGTGHDVTALRVGGEITALFLLPRDVPPAERAAWRRALG